MSHTPQQDYLNGLANLRSQLSTIDAEITKGCQIHPTYLTEDGWTESEYKFHTCLQFLAEKNLLIEKIDNEGGMLSMINDLRATGADPQLISYTTLYWENYYTVMQLLRNITHKYESQVLSKLRLMFSDHMTLPNSTTQLTEAYNSDVSHKMLSIDKLFHRLVTLSQTFQSKVNRDLFESDGISSLIIVRLPRDVTLKLKILISLSNDLLNREEKFVDDMTCAMMKYREVKRDYDRKLCEQRELQLAKINNVNIATMLLQKNTEMLEQLDKELEDLQTQLLNKENDLNATESEIERDQNAIEFLSHTIATTKRNQRLLIKRQNLMKTRKSLEQKLLMIREELETVNQKMQEKADKKEYVETTLQDTKESFNMVSDELNSFAGNICGLEKEVKDIHTNLIDIEILYCIKTSPENIDELRDRPQSVKIARSLRAKITRKRLKHTTTNVVMRDIDSPF